MVYRESDESLSVSFVFPSTKRVSDFRYDETVMYRVRQLLKLGVRNIRMEASLINDTQAAICSAVSLARQARSDAYKGCDGQTYSPQCWLFQFS